LGANEDVRNLIADKTQAGTSMKAWTDEVVDAKGMTLAAVRFHDVILGLMRRKSVDGRPTSGSDV
jgi:hypothetical protein